MANLFRYTIPALALQGDNVGIVDAGDIPALPDNVNGRAAMKFPDGSDESAGLTPTYSVPSPDVWTSGSGVLLRIQYFGDSAGGGNDVVLQAALECISDGDAHDMHADGDFFAAVQEVTDTVNANAGYKNIVDIPFTQAQADAIEPGDGMRIVIRRSSNDGGDDYADSIWIEEIGFFEVTV
jgi:hypothetical protein